MNLFDYLKWKTEHKAEQKRLALERKEAKKAEDLDEDIVNLVGETQGIKAQIETYEKAGQRGNLVFSPHVTIGELQVKLCKAKAKLDHLKLKRMELNNDNSE